MVREGVGVFFFVAVGVFVDVSEVIVRVIVEVRDGVTVEVNLELVGLGKGAEV